MPSPALQIGLNIVTLVMCVVTLAMATAALMPQIQHGLKLLRDGLMYATFAGVLGMVGFVGWSRFWKNGRKGWGSQSNQHNFPLERNCRSMIWLFAVIDHPALIWLFRVRCHATTRCQTTLLAAGRTVIGQCGNPVIPIAGNRTSAMECFSEPTREVPRSGIPDRDQFLQRRQ